MTSIPWSQISARAGRIDLPQLLMNHIDEIPATDLPRAIHQSWTMPEWPGRLLAYELWDVLFGLILNDDEYLLEDRICLASDLDDELVLFRAAAPGYERGMSWTSDFRKAYWFATRFGNAVARQDIYVMIARPQMIWAYFNKRRAENEFVLKFDELSDRNMEKVEPADWQYLLEVNPILMSKESTNASS